jgi:diguanylate cyclase (GGDEF)-like protein
MSPPGRPKGSPRGMKCAGAPVKGPARWLSACMLAGLLAASTPAQAAEADLPQALDALVRRGEDQPAAALAAIDALAGARSTAAQRQRALAAAEVATRSADASEAARRRAAAAEAAQALGGAALAWADEQYLAALRAEHEDLGAVAERARSALSAYDSVCTTLAGATTAPAGSDAMPAAARQRPLVLPGTDGPSAAPAAKQSAAETAAPSAAASAAPSADGSADCEYRPRWRLLQVLSAHARQQHAVTASRQHARAALELAATAGDAWRQAWSESDLALAAAQARDGVRAQQHLERASQYAQLPRDPRLNARLAVAEGNVARDLGDARGAEAAQRRALAIARAAQLPRLEATALVNLSDAAVQSGRAADALDTALQGLAAVRPLQIKRIERALLNNAMLARIALGRKAEARADFEALQAAWSQDGATGMQVTSMREFSDALARAGDLKGALELYHREVELTRKLMAANRDAALAELRTRYDREAQQRGITLLEHDNALKSAALENQALTRRLWALGAGMLALAMVLMLLLVRRVRDSNRALEHSRARLRVQTERDALTGLANRRHFQAVLQATKAPSGSFQGALLMIDIDHFKRINDDHGHGAGDQVLVEVSRRIAGAVRHGDTVARWGGEEFLILAPGLHREATEALALRLLQAVAGAPVPLADSGAPGGGGALAVTASIGHAAFPLPPHHVPLRPEQAVNLADMALYTAKSQGRNCAVGIIDVQAADADGLRALEADFERAWSEGRVRLRVDRGPSTDATDATGGPAMPATVRTHPTTPHSPTTEETHR